MSDNPLEEAAGVASEIRPYTLTSGRTKASMDLPVEATLTLLPPRAGRPPLDASRARIVATCEGSPSVAEISAAVRQPLGVVRVLISDLVETGYLRVQTTLTGESSASERHDLIERTLRGLRAI